MVLVRGLGFGVRGCRFGVQGFRVSRGERLRGSRGVGVEREHRRHCVRCCLLCAR